MRVTVCAGPDEETPQSSPAVRTCRANAFRVLRVAADIKFSLIERQQHRLQIEIELNPLHVNGAFDLEGLTEQEVLQAASLLDRPDTRLLEELFWVHAMDCDLCGEPSSIVQAARRQPAGAVATHNLAVLETIRGQESEPSAWREALQSWKSALNDPRFWDFMDDRGRRIGARAGNSAKWKAEVSYRLSSTLAAQLVLAAENRAVKPFTLLAATILPHRDWLDLDATLQLAAAQLCKEGFVSLGTFWHRIADLRRADNQASNRSVLLQVEQDLACLVAVYGELIRTLDDIAVDEGWEEAVCELYQRLMLASFELLGEAAQCGRLMEQAQALVSDPQLLESLHRDWRHIQWSLLYQQASALLQAGDGAAAERTLDEAVAFATPEELRKLETLRDTCGFARAAAEQQSRLQQRNYFCLQAKLSMQRGEIAAADKNLEAALEFSSTQEEQAEAEAMQDRCDWLRISRGVDMSSTRPALYRLLGCGATFLGRYDYDVRSRSYLTDHWLTALFIPIFPLGTYRVSDTGSRAYSIYGRLSLSPKLQKAQRGIAVTVLLLVLGALMVRSGPKKQIAAVSPPTVAPPTVAPPAVAPPAVTTKPVAPPLRNEMAPERNAISKLAQSLADRRQGLEREESKLKKQQRSLQAVAFAYRREVVPQAGQAIYDARLEDYNSEVKQHERKLVQLRADTVAYHNRVNALNARAEASP